jgi:pilus assembly protein CpaF
VSAIAPVAGPLARLLADARVSEVMVNGPSAVYAEIGGRLERADVRFRDATELRGVIARLVGLCGRRIDDAEPLVDARLPDGSRVNAVLPPLAVDGPLLTIRRFPAGARSLTDLVRLGTIEAADEPLLRDVVRGRANVLVSGATSSGKTTLLAALLGTADAGERVVTVEDAAELHLPLPHVVRLEVRHASVEGRGGIGLRTLVRNALRMRPDRIVVGEVRGGEALDLLMAMNTGHDGSMATIHANSAADALRRLETMALLGGIEIPHGAVREGIASAVNVVVHLERTPDGRRRIGGIAAVEEVETGWRVGDRAAVRRRWGDGG